MGLINQHLGRIADVNDIVELEGARLKVLEMDNRRITKVLFEYVTITNTDLDIDLDTGPPLTDQPTGTFVQRATMQILKKEKVVPLSRDEQDKKAESTSEKAGKDTDREIGS